MITSPKVPDELDEKHFKTNHSENITKAMHNSTPYQHQQLEKRTGMRTMRPAFRRSTTGQDKSSGKAEGRIPRL